MNVVNIASVFRSASKQASRVSSVIIETNWMVEVFARDRTGFTQKSTEVYTSYLKPFLKYLMEPTAPGSDGDIRVLALEAACDHVIGLLRMGRDISGGGGAANDLQAMTLATSREALKSRAIVEHARIFEEKITASYHDLDTYLD